MTCRKILQARGLGGITEESYEGVRLGAPPIPQDETEYLAWSERYVGIATWQSFQLDEHTAMLPPFEIMSHAGFDLGSEQDRKWLRRYIAENGFEYVFLDPLYMLASGITESGADTAELKTILLALTELKNELGTGVVLTHHMTNKGGKSGAPALLGSTFLSGWYEAALFTRRTERSFQLKADSVRDFGIENEYVLIGEGVGEWFYSPGVQGAKDVLGKAAPRVVGKLSRQERLRELYPMHGPGSADPWTYEEFADELGVGLTTVKRDMKEIREVGS